jgi:hypothetical protein
LRVRDIESGQESPGGKSIPLGRGGMEELAGGTEGVLETPFDGICTGIGGGWKLMGAGCYKLVSGTSVLREPYLRTPLLLRHWKNQREASYS